MVLQLDLPPTPATPATEPIRPVIRKIGESRPDEPSVPVYRYFLSGGPAQFQLSVPSTVGLTALSLSAIPFVQMLTGRFASPIVTIGAAISTAIVSVPLAALVTQWGGRSSGVWAGLLTLLGWTVISSLQTPVQILSSSAAVAAILVYGLAELSNREKAIPRAPSIFAVYLGATLSYLFAGPASLAAIAVVFFGTVLGNGNSRDIRFFASPAGLMILIGGIVIRILTRATSELHDSARWFAQSGNHWSPWLAMACLAVGAVSTFASLRSGHGASPLGRLLISWLLGPAVLATAGVIPVPMAIAITLPAWTAVAGIAMTHLRRSLRVKRIAGSRRRSLSRSQRTRAA